MVAAQPRNGDLTAVESPEVGVCVPKRILLRFARSNESGHARVQPRNGGIAAFQQGNRLTTYRVIRLDIINQLIDYQSTG